MWLFIIGSFFVGAYCIAYMVHCIRRKSKIAAIGAAILGVLPIAFGIVLGWHTY